ncbi:MAG: sulfite exporter TauE/SafE family protein [Candidatus Hodarchaeales archaeon]
MTVITDPFLLMGTSFFSFFVGILAAMLGIGGGFVMTPYLIIMLTFDPSWAASTSLFAIVFMSLATTLGFYIQKPRPINIQVGLAYAVMTVPGSIIGTLIKNAFDNPDTLKVVFALCLIPITIKMILFPKKGRKGGLSGDFVPLPLKQFPRKRLGIGLAIAFVGGISAGLLGIGGGVIVVPALTIVLGLSIHSAVATSAFIMIFTSISGTASNLAFGTIDFNSGLAIALGLVLGTQIGVRTVKKFGSEQLHSLFGAVMFIPLVRMTDVTDILAAGDPLLAMVLTVIFAVIINIILFGIKYLVINNARVTNDEKVDTDERGPDR